MVRNRIASQALQGIHHLSRTQATLCVQENLLPAAELQGLPCLEWTSRHKGSYFMLHCSLRCTLGVPTASHLSNLHAHTAVL